jgi:hypothetical protein
MTTSQWSQPILSNHRHRFHAIGICSSRHEHEAWNVLLACQGQLRLAPSGQVIGIDMNTALKIGAARGSNLRSSRSCCRRPKLAWSKPGVPRKVVLIELWGHRYRWVPVASLQCLAATRPEVGDYRPDVIRASRPQPDFPVSVPRSRSISPSSIAMRLSRAASAAATSAASNLWGMCCGQFASQAATVKRMTCWARAL